ncbi:uncharacterized protein A1O9_07187 [Exophiala aquamarina CBS 119918]|uniref:DUF4484 domain-containing protein n=1 Tax=Exophiala aquamarina CBS 119918 TaxID=1182545 RepID=A0A072PB45_9EURO|nr:uncharacterized protein A1O9_07187 [Exophiala aquamarina CBS 119918]KEF56997.1 hypothetical protein A1O9_07187 [Exophiala aquamarina CBS 119918]
MPSSESEHARAKVFPRLVESTPSLTKTFPKTGIKSTQRDFHRYVHLHQGLHRYPSGRPSTHELGENDETSSLASHSSSFMENKHVVEPPSWSRVAYTSLIWWASAGDRRGGFSEMEEIEMERDLALLHDESDEEQIREVAVVAYFHRLTNLIFMTIAEAVARADGHDLDESASYHDESREGSPVADCSVEHDSPIDNEDDVTQGLLSSLDQNSPVDITQDDMTAMGLDSWSPSDKVFIEEMLSLWWGRKANVRAASVECCGLKVL